MSNQIRRPPLRGMIIQGNRVVGGLDLPNPPEPVIEQFNHEYAAIGLRVEQVGVTPVRNALYARHEAVPSMPTAGA